MKPQDASADSPIAQVARLKITLDDSQPQIMRRIAVPLTSTLHTLHEVIQAVMLFENYHLFRFDVGPRGHETHYGIPDPDGFMDVIDARRATLDQLIDAKLKKFTYTYDFGDDWRHTITVEAVTFADPALTYPRFIDGAHRAPPEDVGGQPGFENFLIVMADPKHPEHADLKRWYGRTFNPDDIAETQIAARLAKVAKRKPKTKPAATKSKRHFN
jgi:hypothetical protein